MWGVDDDDDLFDGPGRRANINLSTNVASSSTSLLSTVKKERLAREQRRKEERAASTIQRVWRGRTALVVSRGEVLDHLEQEQGVVKLGRGLVGVLKLGVGQDGPRLKALMVRWAEAACKSHEGRPAFAQILRDDGKSQNRGYPSAVLIGLLCIHAARAIADSPGTGSAAKLLAFAELALSPSSYLDPAGSLANITDILAQRQWIETLVIALEKLVALSLPKKKHPHLQAVTRLLTAPLGVSPDHVALFIPPLITHLLAVPALPQSLPIPSLTHLSQRLPLFTSILPTAAAEPALLSHGKLSTELGRTYFLANIATFAITGGMLARYGVQGAEVWVRVVATLLSGVEEGWGRWAEGIVDEPEDVIMDTLSENGSDDDEVELADGAAATVPPLTKRHRQTRAPLPTNIASRLLLLGSATHVSTLADLLVSPSSSSSQSTTSTSPLIDFASFTLSLLNAFKGTPRWEAILDSLLEGKKRLALAKRMWREGVRGKWSTDRDPGGWQAFRSNDCAPCLVLLTHLYCHYLLLTPDDEFFAENNSSNPLSLDEVLELGAIWRDLAFWGYMAGVTSEPSVTDQRGDEDTRALFTKGVTRMAARNARRKFAPDEYWVMSSQMELASFVEAAVFEDAELSLSLSSDASQPSQPRPPLERNVNPYLFPNFGNISGHDEHDAHIRTNVALPRWVKARQQFTKRQLAYLSPRLGLLNNLPMAVPFRTRLEVFRQFVKADRKNTRDERYRRHGSCSATIHRDTLAEDGFRQLNHEGPRLKGRIRIVFIDQFGQEESGIDGGGLFKEFLTSLSKEAFDTNRGLWLVTNQNELYPNPHSYATEEHQLSWYGFIGRILGKALYEGILVDVSFASFFLAKWLGRQSYLDDLASLDRELYKGLTILKSYPKPEDLSLNFTITEQEFGVARSVDLVPGGSDIAVTADNRQDYIQLVCKYKLDKQIAAQSRAFFNGLSDIIDQKWLRMFDQAELAQLIGGENTSIDMDDLREHSVVTGYPNDKTIKAFWAVVKAFKPEEKRALVKFVTSCARPPLLGFAHLNPQFGIRCAGADITRLPSASSCANLLKLPDYQDARLLRDKLLQAINSGAGFDLS